MGSTLYLLNHCPNKFIIINNSLFSVRGVYRKSLVWGCYISSTIPLTTISKTYVGLFALVSSVFHLEITVDSLYLEHPLSRTFFYPEQFSRSLSIDSSLIFSLYLELSLSRTNSLVPCEFDRERVHCIFNKQLLSFGGKNSSLEVSFLFSNVYKIRCGYSFKETKNVDPSLKSLSLYIFFNNQKKY